MSPTAIRTAGVGSAVDVGEAVGSGVAEAAGSGTVDVGSGGEVGVSVGAPPPTRPVHAAHPMPTRKAAPTIRLDLVPVEFKESPSSSPCVPQEWGL
jgi:hypothetical protein